MSQGLERAKRVSLDHLYCRTNYCFSSKFNSNPSKISSFQRSFCDFGFLPCVCTSILPQNHWFLQQNRGKICVFWLYSHQFLLMGLINTTHPQQNLNIFLRLFIYRILLLQIKSTKRYLTTAST